MVHTRTFWPPTPPPEAYSRCGSVSGSYYPMFSSMPPIVPSSDLTFSCGSLLPRLPSPSNPFMHLLSNHKDTPFLPLRLNSPVSSNPQLPLPYLHLPSPSLDHRYSSSSGLFSPLSLHNIQGGVQELPKVRHSELEVKPCEKAIKSEPLSLSANSDKEQTPLHLSSTEISDSGKRSKSSPKLANAKAREKHDAKKEEQKRLPVLCSNQYRKVSQTIPVMTATVSPCNVLSSCSTRKQEPVSVKCSKCPVNVEETFKKEKVIAEESGPIADENKDCVPVKYCNSGALPICHVSNSASLSKTAVTTTVASVQSSGGISSVTHNNRSKNSSELASKSVTQPDTVVDTAPCPQPVIETLKPLSAVKKAQSPVNMPSSPLSSNKGQTEDTKPLILGPAAGGHIGSPVIGSPSVGNSSLSPIESHVSTVCTFSSWVHHQTSVTSVIKQDHSDTDSCLHSVQSQMTVVNLSMDKGVMDSPKNSQTAKSESTLIFQMQNTHNAQQVKCHQVSETSKGESSSLLNQNESSKCSVKELGTVDTLQNKKLPKENTVFREEMSREKEVAKQEFSVDKFVWNQERSNLQQQAINLSMDRSKPSGKTSPILTATGQQKGVNCDIPKASQVTATQALDSLSRLAQSPSGNVNNGLACGQNSCTWKSSTNKVKPSSVVSSIQSENLRMKVAVDRTVSSPVTASTVTISGAGSCTSSPSIQPVRKGDSALAKIQEVNCKVAAKEDNKMTKICSILPTQESSSNSSASSTISVSNSAISNPIPTTSASSSIPVGIAVAQLRHDNSTVSIKKAVVKANTVTIDNRTIIPATVDKGDKRFIKSSITKAADATMLVNSTPALNQWDASNTTLVQPATLSGSWIAPAPAPPVVTPTVWLGPSYQSATAQATPCIGQPLGSLVEATSATTNAIVPPVGYHLARDPITGHLYLIPAPNIDIVDRSNVWSTYSPNPVQQVISHFPTTINGTKKEIKPILTCSQILEKSELPIIQPRLLQPSDQTVTQEIKDIKSLNAAVQSSVTSITVQTGQPFTFPGFATTSQPALSYFYDQPAMPTIVHIAQTQTVAPSLPTVTQVQAEPGKRSQGTSPLNSMTPSPPPQLGAQTSEYESDLESVVGSETSNKASVGVSCQVDMDACSGNSNDAEYDERTVEVFDSANQTDNLLLESFKEEPEDVSPASLVVREEIEDEEEKELNLEQHPEVKEEIQENDQIDEPNLTSCITPANTNNNSLDINFEAEEEEMATPILPTESKPVIDFIDQHGLNLLVDSIEEFASREQKDINPEPDSIRLDSCSEVDADSKLSDNSSKPHLSSFGIETSCTDGLGLLCALAEQRFLEETKNFEEDQTTDSLSRTRSCSPDAPYSVRVGRPVCRQKTGARSSSFTSSRCQSPVLLNPAELEMRFKLAELQRKYKLKQKELAKLKAKKEKDNLTDNCALYVHSSATHECLDEGTRKKRGKAQHRSMSVDTLPLKMNIISDDTNERPNPGEDDNIADVDMSAAQEFNPLPSPIKVTTKITSDSHPQKVHHVFPNLVKISTKKLSESEAVPTNFGSTTCKLKSSGKKKDKNANTNIFQIWKEKKLVTLSKLSGKPSGSSNTVKMSTSKARPFSRSVDIPINNMKNELCMSEETTSQANQITASAEPHDNQMKRKASTLTSEDIEDENVKRLKLETSENRQETLSDQKEKDSVSNASEEDKTSLNNAQPPKAKKREKRLSTSSDDVWNRRRSERIFLHDAGVILPSSLAYSDKDLANSNGSSNRSPRSPEPPKKKMTRKELGLKKLKFKEAEKQNQVPLEMFLALRQCRLNELGLANNMGVLTSAIGLNKASSSQDDSSGSEGDLPLSKLLQAVKKHILLPELPTCQMQVCDLRDCQRVLMEEDDLYYAGYITAIQAPDVYGITLDRERGNRPHIFSREEMLEQTVKEIKPIHVKQIPEGTRVCAYWSQQYRCLYPGTVTKGNGEVSSEDTNTVFVEFDDGDSGRIPLEDVRLLLPDPNYKPSNNNNTVDEDSKTKEQEAAQMEGPFVCLDNIDLLAEEVKKTATDRNLILEDNEDKGKVENTSKGKTEKSSKSKNKSNAKGIKSGIKSQASKVKKKLKSKSKSEEKLKSKAEKNKIKGQSVTTEESLATLMELAGSHTGLLEQELLGTEHSLPLQHTDENGNCIKAEKASPSIAKIGAKKLQKLKNCSFLLKKSKHHLGDSSVLEKIKSFKKSRKDKGDYKENSKADKESSDTVSTETCSTGEGKVKKRKKHKAEHKHHHHHHKKHCHHHHKKHKRKNDPQELGLSHPSSPVLTISIGSDPKGTLPSGDDSLMDMPMCCVSPGRSELSVKIKASPPSSSCLPPKTSEALSSVTAMGGPGKKEEKLKNPQQKNVFLFPVKKSTKGGDKPVSVKADSSNKGTSSESKPAKKHKERKISCEKSKIAAFLPARQLWRWSGKGYKRPGTKGKAKKEYFKAITRGKETIRVGDCAVFLSTGRPHLPYVGHIETMWQSWGGNTVVKVKWFYHPEETKGGKKLAHPKGALFQSPHVDENDVQTISHKCEVLSWSDYQKWCEKKGSSHKGSFENEDVYYLAGTYEPLTKVLTLEPGVS